MSKMHVSLIVTDIEASLVFYKAFFGVAPHKVRDGYANFDLDLPPLKLALNVGVADGRGSLDHLASSWIPNSRWNPQKGASLPLA